jgi:hypothetical protein
MKPALPRHRYKTFYKQKSALVEADSAYAAQLLGARELRAKTIYDVHVMLIQKSDGTHVAHHTAALP